MAQNSKQHTGLLLYAKFGPDQRRSVVWCRIFRTLLGWFWGKIGKNGETFRNFILLRECNNVLFTSYESNSIKSDAVWSRDASINWSQKNHARVIFCQYAGTPPTGAIGLNFGVPGYVADVTTRTKFCDCRFKGFGVLKAPI